MPISLFSPTGASLVDGQPRKTLTDQAMPGDMLIVCECPELSPHVDAASAGRCRHRVLSVHFGRTGLRVERGPRW